MIKFVNFFRLICYILGFVIFCDAECAALLIPPPVAIPPLGPLGAPPLPAPHPFPIHVALPIPPTYGFEIIWFMYGAPRLNADIIAFNNMTFQTYNTNNNLLLLVGGGGGALPAGNSREVLSLYNGAIPPGIVRSPVIQAQNANLAFGAGVAAASQMLLRKAQSGIIVTLNNPINQAALLGGLAANVVTVFWRLH